MSEAKFTKNMEVGCSDFNAQLCVDGFCNVDGLRFEACTVWGVDDCAVSCDQSKANAYLFAAAPEMYDYLDGLHESLCLNGGVLTIDEDDFEYIGKLLAKARGEQNA